MEKFNLEFLQRSFLECILEGGDILLDKYIEGYLEVNKFFQLMGSVFSFVSNDVEEKIQILANYRLEAQGEKYTTFRGMIEFEKNENLLFKSSFTSGSRTLLRLHRGLDFIRDFLRRLPALKSSEKTSSACQAAYNDTLAKFHPWIVRKGAIVAMYTMPAREDLLQRVCVDPEKAVMILPSVLEVIKDVFDRTEMLFTQFNLHDLP